MAVESPRVPRGDRVAEMMAHTSSTRRLTTRGGAAIHGGRNLCNRQFRLHHCYRGTGNSLIGSIARFRHTTTCRASQESEERQSFCGDSPRVPNRILQLIVSVPKVRASWLGWATVFEWISFADIMAVLQETCYGGASDTLHTPDADDVYGATAVPGNGSLA